MKTHKIQKREHEIIKCKMVNTTGIGTWTFVMTGHNKENHIITSIFEQTKLYLIISSDEVYQSNPNNTLIMSQLCFHTIINT